MVSIDREATDRLLSALARRLSLAGKRFEFVVIGGTALIALGESDGFARELTTVLRHLGVEDADPGAP